MKGFANYLRTHNRVRASAIVGSFFTASVALFAGIGIYVLTLGPKAIRDYVHDRFMAGCFIAIAVLVNVGTALLLTRGGRFLSRLLLSILITSGGAILVFGLVVVRAIIAHGLSAR